MSLRFSGLVLGWGLVCVVGYGLEFGLLDWTGVWTLMSGTTLAILDETLTHNMLGKFRMIDKNLYILNYTLGSRALNQIWYGMFIINHHMLNMNSNNKSIPMIITINITST